MPDVLYGALPPLEVRAHGRGTIRKDLVLTPGQYVREQLHIAPGPLHDAAQESGVDTLGVAVNTGGISDGDASKQRSAAGHWPGAAPSSSSPSLRTLGLVAGAVGAVTVLTGGMVAVSAKLMYDDAGSRWSLLLARRSGPGTGRSRSCHPSGGPARRRSCHGCSGGCGLLRLGPNAPQHRRAVSAPVRAFRGPHIPGRTGTLVGPACRCQGRNRDFLSKKMMQRVSDAVFW